MMQAYLLENEWVSCIVVRSVYMPSMRRYSDVHNLLCFFPLCFSLSLSFFLLSLYLPRNPSLSPLDSAKQIAELSLALRRQTADAADQSQRAAEAQARFDREEVCVR